MASTDPSADAFMRRILDRPDDPIPRLVFADWLEESGTSSNIAWARYLRLAEELGTITPDDPRQTKLRDDLDRIGTCIRARLTYRAELLTAFPEAMLRVLPARNMHLTIRTLTVPTAIVEALPESIVREFSIFPLAQLRPDNAIIVGSPRPLERRRLEPLRFITNRPIVSITLEETGFLDLIQRHYGAAPTEVVASVSYLWLPTDGVQRLASEESSPIHRIADVLLLETVVYAATALEIAPDPDRVTAWYWFGGLRREVDAPSRTDLVEIAADLRRAAGILTPSGVGELTLTYWGRPRRLPIRITETAHGPHLHIAFPPDSPDPPAIMNPAA